MTMNNKFSLGNLFPSRRGKLASPLSDKIFGFFNSIFLIFMFIIALYPIIFVLSASISDPHMVNTGKMLLWPVGISWTGYEKLMIYKDLWVGYGNTIFYTVCGTTCNLLATLPCAYALSRRDFSPRNKVMVFFMFTMFFGGGMIPGYLNVRDLGLVNTRFYIIIHGLISVSNLIVCRTFFANTIPWEMQEAAMLDGASDFGLFTQIILPLSKPIIAVMSLYYGVGRWNSYFTEMIYLKDREKFPLQLILKEILADAQLSASQLGELTDVEEILAMLKRQDTANMLKYCVIVAATLPMMLIYPWLQKYFEKGVMIGSVKG
jgi:putative aldouronate transport system permease protein